MYIASLKDNYKLYSNCCVYIGCNHRALDARGRCLLGGDNAIFEVALLREGSAFTDAKRGFGAGKNVHVDGVFFCVIRGFANAFS